MTELISIINPCRILKVQDFRKITNEICKIIQSTGGGVYPKTSDIIERYESLTSKHLVKGMFVCEMKKPVFEDFPKLAGFDSKALEDATIKYEAEHDKVWFTGFELYVGDSIHNKGVHQLIIKNSDLHFPNKVIRNCNTFDFIYHISKYNETAKEPIKINFTENFVKQLIQ